MKPINPSSQTTYTCPMHPEVKSGQPGKCPKCGMDLVPDTTSSEETPNDVIRDKPFTGQGKNQNQEVYTCPMHPEVVSDKPGNCPKCGMKLVKNDGNGHARHAEAGMKSGDMTEMTRDMRRSWLWTNALMIMLGLWLVSSPFTFGYVSSKMIWSDVISGILLIIFAIIAFLPRFDFWGRWGACFVGVWLQFAPLVFWAPTSTSFVTDTLVGALAITFSVLVPMMPGMAHHMEMMKPGPEIPPGWSYNPSTWHQRSPMIIAAFLGWLFSRYLAAYQLGYIKEVWEPFFGEGTVRVLTSKVSKSWPISDAGLGATSYTFELLMAWMGGVTRWRTMPWMVTFFFILVVPLGVTSIVLVILQPVAVGFWCTVCLLTALIMLVMIPFTVDEVVAMIQFMKRSVREGKSFWRTFWVGGTLDEENKDNRTPSYGASLSKLTSAAGWGVSVPWNLLLSTALGIWLMFYPGTFGVAGTAADYFTTLGALAVTFSVIAMAEVARPLRFINLAITLWLVIALLLVKDVPSQALWNGIISGAVLIALSVPKGKVREKYGTFDKFIV